jgi:hypothetical protein
MLSAPAVFARCCSKCSMQKATMNNPQIGTAL